MVNAHTPRLIQTIGTKNPIPANCVIRLEFRSIPKWGNVRFNSIAAGRKG